MFLRQISGKYPEINNIRKVAIEQDLSIGAVFSGKKYSDVLFF
jgi:hypothetical protein